jgi:hypothetical protein
MDPSKSYNPFAYLVSHFKGSATGRINNLPPPMALIKDNKLKPAPQVPDRNIMLLHLDYHSEPNPHALRLMSAITEGSVPRATVELVTDIAVAMRRLTSPSSRFTYEATQTAIVALDSTFAAEDRLLDPLVNYCQRAGGRLIIAYPVASQNIPGVVCLDHVFGRLELPWKVIEVGTSAECLIQNPVADFGGIQTRSLPITVLPIAMYLSNVNMENTLYKPFPLAPEGAETGETMHQPSVGHLAAVAWVEGPNGYFGYVGELGAVDEIKMARIVIAMCGIVFCRIPEGVYNIESR